MSLALILIVAGLVITFGAPIFAEKISLAGIFREHIGAMFTMALGMLMFTLGIIFAVGDFLSRMLP